MDNARSLTGAGGKFELSAQLRGMLCFTSDRRMFVSSSHRADPEVLSFLDLMRRKGEKFSLHYVAVSQIQKIYEDGRVEAAESEESSASASQNDVMRLLREAASLGASDVHLRVKRDFTELWMRRDGIMEKRHEMSVPQGKALCSTIYQSMCDVADPIYLPEKAQSARLKPELLAQFGLNGARLASRPTDTGSVMVLRLLYRKKTLPTLERLGFMPLHLELFGRMQQRTRGINLISGATGSGKSTTLEVVLSALMAAREYRINLITVEDPPEYAIAGAVQTPVVYDARAADEEVSQAWARSISDLMRLDPDTVMVGEIRDLASAKSAFRLAMTGHSVWSTIHANDTTATLTRLLDIGVDKTLVTDPGLLTGLVSQSLAPRLCQQCRIPLAERRATLKNDLLQRLERHCRQEGVFLQGAGCAECGGRGINGRTVVAEMVLPDVSMMQIFLQEGVHGVRRYWMQELGGLSKTAHLIHLVETGLVDPVIGEAFVGLLDAEE